VRWQIWQRITGRRVTVTGKREVFELLIPTHDARTGSVLAHRGRAKLLIGVGDPPRDGLPALVSAAKYRRVRNALYARQMIMQSR
jgi:hypothetical protein